uniref:uncharacterized protein si:ch211-170d8.2 n=1 Tax=Doryrhamphus excisus TaxID=161450 RepID=UPI0025AE5B0A|nr:uncharacterized protein si:ch211-170d8.2 [Doryrhamphus excisus]
MASSRSSWTALLCLISVLSSSIGVLGRALDAHGSVEASLRTDVLRHRERCAELTASWLQNSQVNPLDKSTVLRLSVRPLSAGISRGSVFPEKPLFSFVRRVYRCCQDGLDCRSVKGLQGGLGFRGSDVEFLLSREILALTIRRAELHLQLFNPQHADIHPVLPSMAKSDLPTRYISRSHGDTVELRVDLLFFFQNIQEAIGGPGGGGGLVNIRKVSLSSLHEKLGAFELQDNGGDAWGELGLALGCSQGGVAVSCESSGVHLLHTPFLALYYL